MTINGCCASLPRGARPAWRLACGCGAALPEQRSTAAVSWGLLTAKATALTFLMRLFIASSCYAICAIPHRRVCRCGFPPRSCSMMPLARLKRSSVSRSPTYQRVDAHRTVTDATLAHTLVQWLGLDLVGAPVIYWRWNSFAPSRSRACVGLRLAEAGSRDAAKVLVFA